MVAREMIIEELKNKGYEVASADVTKNGMTLQGIVMGKGNIRPTIYVDDLLDRTLEDATNEVIKIYENSQKNIANFDLNDIHNWDNMKHKLQLCLQKQGKEDIVKREVLDLEQYVRAIISVGDGEVGSFKVTQSNLKMWNITEEQLFECAWDCTKPTLVAEDMLKILSKLMGADEIELLAMMGNTPRQIVLSNQNKVHGAIAMCDIDLLSKIADEHETDLAILPSSIHEVIVLLVDENTDFERLDEMVQEVNRNEVAPNEVLSNHSYRFYRETKSII